MENTEKRQIIEEFLKFAKEVYDAELTDYDLLYNKMVCLSEVETEEIIDHFIKGE